jgi:hypothetical protein
MVISRLTAIAGALLLASPLAANDEPRHCTTTAALQIYACVNEIQDDFFIAHAICINIEDAEEREECREEALESIQEEQLLCRDQFLARADFCDNFGEERYEPDFDPELFEDDFSNPANPNPYFPLGIGNQWVFEAEDETTTIVVENKTKLIDGVTCIVVNDVVSEDELLIEDTDDWFGLRLNGDVDYCGEAVQDFEYPEGDDPPEAELVEIDGSFKAGRDGDKSGTLFPGNPVVGQYLRQEWSASNAEDVAVVLSTSYQYGDDPELDANVPQELAELMCGDTPCVVLREFSPIEPGPSERKYFASGVGKWLEVDQDSGDIAELSSCNFHPKCDEL